MNRHALRGMLCLHGRFVGVCLLWLVTTAMGDGPCRIEQPASSAMMVRILTGECSEEERLSLAISAKDVLAALQAGQGVRLDGVSLKGDLMLDSLPMEPIPDRGLLPVVVKDRFEKKKLTEVRVLKGPLILHDVDVQGILATNLVKHGFMIAQGPVSITGSTFRRSVDFSRVIFLDQVDFSKTTIGYEGFFIQSMFLKSADFSNADFGTHSRFHKAVFAGDATFKDAGFHGLAEFLEVGFFKEADFSETRFAQGTGFSGSRFREAPDFSGSTFERETFFRFAQFEKGGKFRGGIFRKTADFTEATFRGEADFSRVVFDEPPEFTDAALADRFRSVPGVRDPQAQAGLFVLAGLFLLLFFFLIRKNANKSHR